LLGWDETEGNIAWSIKAIKDHVARAPEVQQAIDSVMGGEVAECLSEAIELMEAVREGEYKPDSVTTQPWRNALGDRSAPEGGEGS